MSIKDLFGKTSKDLEETVQDVESVKFVEEKSKKQERYLPPVDFSDPKNFVYYGSAELYYDAAIRRIYEDYPYDGSKAEQIEFEERSSHLERWLFENRYPKTTGYIELGTTGDISTPTSGQWVATNTNEYIRVWGGLHTDESTDLRDKFQKSAKFDETKNRNQNWNCDFDKGVTIEFWMKKVDNGLSGFKQEVILDLWNGIDPIASDPEYSRLLLSTITYTTGEVYLFLSIQNGTTSNLASLELTSPYDWNHYSVSIKKEDPNGTIRLYVNGDEQLEQALVNPLSSFSKRIDGFIGALQEYDYFGNGATGHGKLSAYLDEFRFWKTERTARQIKLNWFSQVGGGANTDDATSDLGVYFKFNEGIVGNSVTDSVVLDYSGRLANGLWIGYPDSSARNTGSAIEAVGYTEPATPIIYSNHPEVTALSTEMQESGSFYDAERGQAFYNSMPTWLQQDDNENLRYISQILASYLDTLHVQIKQMTELKNKDYTPEGLKASTMAQDLLKDKGFLTSNIFGMNEVYEKLSDLDIQDGQFESDLNEIKNTIYTNIYNNLEKIYKSKGTETSIRNFIRCFGIDDELVKLNLYTDGGVQYLSDKSRVTSVKKKYINFNHPNHFSATIYQTFSDSNANTFIDGSSTGTNASNSAFTLEADIVVPHKKERGENGYFGTPFLSSSVFGFHHANETDETDYGWILQENGIDSATAIVDFELAGFPADWEGDTITLTATDGTQVVYEFTTAEPAVLNGGQLSNGNTKVEITGAFWSTTRNFHFAVSLAQGTKISSNWTGTGGIVDLEQVEPGASGNTEILCTLPEVIITGFEGGTSEIVDSYDLQVHLVRDSVESNHAKFVLKNEAETIYQESNYVYDIYDNEHYNVAVRIKPQTYPYAGGVTNTTPDYDIEMYAITNNLGEIKEEVLLSQTVDFNTGSAYMNVAKRVYAGAHVENFTGSVLQKSDVQIGSIRAWLDYLGDEEIQNHNKDVLNYGSRRSIDGSNIYTVDDQQIPTHDLTILNWDFDTVLASDGSGQFIVEDITSGSIDTIYGWVDDIIRREHRARGDFFPSEDSSFLSNEFLYSLKKQLPETAYNSENIFIKGEQEINFSDDDDVSDNLFILEKSPANLVSEEMLKSFSTTMEFANLVGRPIDRYRLEYKDLAKARELFFNKVESDLDFDRFFEYFKWIDSSISSMVNQLIPLSANFAGGIVDVIEPHILERDKYQRQIGLLSTVTSTEASIRGIQELKYNWKFGHAPLSENPGDPIPENENCLWHKERRERDENFVADADLGAALESVREAAVRQADQEFTNPVNLSGSDGIYQGNTYATRRFSRPVKLDIGFNNSIHGGINYDKNKDRDFLHTVVRPHGEIGGSLAPKNIMTIGAGVGNGLNPLVDCIDVEDPNKLIKRDGTTQVGKFSDDDNELPLEEEYGYVYRRKVSHVFPGNIVSSSVNTGYSEALNKAGNLGGFGEGLNVVNLHSDTTDITNEIPIQGPFTQQWIGGHQSRHVHINKVGRSEWYPDELDNIETRPEAWRFLIAQNPIEDPSPADGAVGFTGPDYGASYPAGANQLAIYYREDRVKRPVNIKNIKTIIGTGSAGNYVRGYEVFSTFGDQGYFLRRHADASLLPPQIAETLPQTTNPITLVAQSSSVDVGNVFGQPSNRFDVVAKTQDRSIGSINTIRTKFSAPGGPEVNTSGYLDVATQQYSVHNSINFRNLTVRASGSGEYQEDNVGNILQSTIRVNSHSNRREGLRTLRTRHQGQFGIDPQHGVVSATDYIAEASFHKQHRNNIEKITPVDAPARGVRFANSENEYLEIESLSTDGEVDLTTKKLSFSFWLKQDLNSSENLILSSDNISIYIQTISSTRKDIWIKLLYNTLATPQLRSLYFNINDVPGLDRWSHYIISLNLEDYTLSKLLINGVEKSGETSESLISPDWSMRPFAGKIKLAGGYSLPILHTGASEAYSLSGSIMNFAYFDSFIHDDPEALSILADHTRKYEIDNISSLVNFWYLGEETSLSSGDPIENGLELKSAYGRYTETFATVVPGSPVTDVEIVDGFYSYIAGVREGDQVFNNDHYTSLLPASAFQYSWINSTLSGSDHSGVTWESRQRIVGHAPKSGQVAIVGEGYVDAIVFPTISEIECVLCTGDVPTIILGFIYETLENSPVEKSGGGSYLIYVLADDLADGSNFPLEIWEEDIENLVFTTEYEGCCDESSLEYKLKVFDSPEGVGTVIEYDWNTEVPSLPKIVYTGNTGDNGDFGDTVISNLSVKDCRGYQEDMSVRFLGGKIYQPPVAMSLEVGLLAFGFSTATLGSNLGNPYVEQRVRVINTENQSAGGNLAGEYFAEILKSNIQFITAKGTYTGMCPDSEMEQRLKISTVDGPIQQELGQADSGWVKNFFETDVGETVPAVILPSDWQLDPVVYYDFFYRDCGGCAIDCDENTFLQVRLILEYCLAEQTTFDTTISYETTLREGTQYLQHGDSLSVIQSAVYSSGASNEILNEEIETIDIFATYAETCCPEGTLTYELKVYEIINGVKNQKYWSEVQTDPNDDSLKRYIPETYSSEVRYVYSFGDCDGNTQDVEIDFVRCTVETDFDLKIRYQEASTSADALIYTDEPEPSTLLVRRAGELATDASDIRLDQVEFMTLDVGYVGCCPEGSGLEYKLEILNPDGSALNGEVIGWQSTIPQRALLESDPSVVMYRYSVRDCGGSEGSISVILEKCVESVQISATYTEEGPDNTSISRTTDAATNDTGVVTETIEVILQEDSGTSNKFEIKQFNIAEIVINATSDCCSVYYFQATATDEVGNVWTGPTVPNDTYLPPIVYADIYQDPPGSDNNVTPKVTLDLTITDCNGTSATLQIVLEKAKLAINENWRPEDPEIFTFEGVYSTGFIGSEQAISPKIQGHEGDYRQDASDGFIVTDDYSGFRYVPVELYDARGPINDGILFQSLSDGLKTIRVQGDYQGYYLGDIEYKLQAYQNPDWTSTPTPDYDTGWVTSEPDLSILGLYYANDSTVVTELIFTARTPSGWYKEIVIQLPSIKLDSPSVEMLIPYETHDFDGALTINGVSSQTLTVTNSLQDEATEIAPNELNTLEFNEVHIGPTFTLDYQVVIEEYDINETNLAITNVIKRKFYGKSLTRHTLPTFAENQSRKLEIRYTVGDSENSSPVDPWSRTKTLLIEGATILPIEPTEMSLTVTVNRMGFSAGQIEPSSDLNSAQPVVLDLTAVSSYGAFSPSNAVTISDLISLVTSTTYDGLCYAESVLTERIQKVTIGQFVFPQGYSDIDFSSLTTGDFYVAGSDKRTDIQFSYEDCEENTVRVVLRISNLEYTGPYSP